MIILNKNIIKYNKKIKDIKLKESKLEKEKTMIEKEKTRLRKELKKQKNKAYKIIDKKLKTNLFTSSDKDNWNIIKKRKPIKIKIKKQIINIYAIDMTLHTNNEVSIDFITKKNNNKRTTNISDEIENYKWTKKFKFKTLLELYNNIQKITN